jgi:hypothetical protein
MKLATELIMTEFLKLRAHRARIKAANVSAEAKRAGVVSIVKDPLAGVALKPWCASVLHIEQEIVTDSAEENGSPELGFAVHAEKIQEALGKVN